MPLNITSFRLLNTVIPNSHHYWLCSFTNYEQGPACCSCKKSSPAEATHSLPASMTVSLSGKCCLHSQLSSTQTDGSQKAPNPDYAAGVVGQSSHTLQHAPWSSNG
jgi:hypothetical protein